MYTGITVFPFSMWSSPNYFGFSFFGSIASSSLLQSYEKFIMASSTFTQSTRSVEKRSPSSAYDGIDKIYIQGGYNSAYSPSSIVEKISVTTSTFTSVSSLGSVYTNTSFTNKLNIYTQYRNNVGTAYYKNKMVVSSETHNTLSSSYYPSNAISGNVQTQTQGFYFGRISSIATGAIQVLFSNDTESALFSETNAETTTISSWGCSKLHGYVNSIKLQNGSYQTTRKRFDFSTGTFSATTSNLVATYNSSCYSSKDKLYRCGGQISPSPYWTASSESLNFSTLTAITESSMTQSRAESASSSNYLTW